MQGDKLRYAQATLSALVDELGPDDRFALVVFDDHVDVAVPPTAMTASAKALVRSAVPAITARGATDLSAAVLRSLSVARDAGDGPWHVIVLTDGAPTSGVTNEDQILTLAGGAVGQTTLSVFGYGVDVRSELLGRLSDLARGHYTSRGQ
jgi:secreted protein with Ig-like and vWFA domain